MPYLSHLNEAFPQAEWMELLETLPETARRLPADQKLQGGRNELHWFEHAGRKVVLKRFVNNGAWKKIAYCISTSKARRSYEHSDALIQAGLRAPSPIAWSEVRSGPWLIESYFLSDYANIVHEARAIPDRPEIDWQPLVQLMGRSIARMHEAGLLHLDLTPGNLIFVDEGSDDWALHFIDNNRMRFGPVSLVQGIRSLLQPEIEGDHLQPYVAAYAETRSFDTERCLQLYQRLQGRYRLKWRIKNATRPWRRKLGL